MTAARLGGAATLAAVLALAAAAAAADRPPVPGAGEVFRDCPHCPEMVVVPAGSFAMGTPSSKGDRDNEGPVHRVEIRSAFAVGVYEVTRGEFSRFASAVGHAMENPCWRAKSRGWLPSEMDWRDPGFPQTDDHPAICVSWEDARAFAGWLSRETGRDYRLLSESEWEYTARAGTSTPVWWGGDIGRNRANCRECGSRWDDEGTAPVGSFAANGFGLHDVHGNVWEWTRDCWNEGYEGAPGDGRAWEDGDCSRRAVRGGAWIDRPEHIRSAVRGGVETGNRFDVLGFRVARTLAP